MPLRIAIIVTMPKRAGKSSSPLGSIILAGMSIILICFVLFCFFYLEL